MSEPRATLIPRMKNMHMSRGSDIGMGMLTDAQYEKVRTEAECLTDTYQRTISVGGKLMTPVMRFSASSDE